MGFVPNPYYTEGTPKGSIFFNFTEEDAERDRLARAQKVATNTSYFDKCQWFREVQEKRAFIPLNEYYEMLRIKALNAADKERQSRIALAGQMFLKHAMGAKRSHFIALMEITKKNIRAKRFLMERMVGSQRRVFIAWADCTFKFKRVRAFINKHMASSMTKSFSAWKEYVIKNKKIKKLFGNHMQKFEAKNFIALKEYVKRTRYVRLKMAKHLVGAKMDKFMRWKNYAETSRKIKNLVGKHFVGLLRTTFVEWFVWTGRSIKVKRLLAGHFLGLQKSIFLAWRGVTDQWKKERLTEAYKEQEFTPDDFMNIDSWGLPKHTEVPNLRPNYRGPQTKYRMY